MTLRTDYPILEGKLKDSDIPGKEKHKRNISIVYALVDGAKQKEVAQEFTISPERVRQIWILTSLKQSSRLQRETL